MKLRQFIKEIGPAEFAMRVGGITPRTAVAYMCRQRLPRAEVARRIVANTPITWADIYGADDGEAA